jgi:hypothetical protein
LSNQQFSLVKKDRLFYDQYEYCIGFYLHEASCLRVLDHDYINDMITRRQQWREIAQQRWNQGSRQFANILGRRHREITEKTVEDLHAVAELLLTAPEEFKLVVSVNQAYVYTNDSILINRLDRMPCLELKTYSQAVISRPKNTVVLKNPKHQFRSYFKTMNLTTQQKDHLESFLINQADHVRVSSALQKWIDCPFTRIQDYFFVDYNTQTWLTLLNLVQPGIIRKTMHIIPAK